MPELLKPYLNNVMLIEPQNGVYTGFQGLARTEPLGLEYVAGAICPLGSDQRPLVKSVSIHDDRLQPGGWIEKVRQNPPDMIGIRLSYTADVPIVHQLLKEIRREVGKDIPIVVGGHHISHRPSDAFIDEVDAVVIGSGEKPMQELVESWSKFHSFKAARNVWYKDEGGDWHSNVDPVKFSPLFELESCLMNERPMPRRDLVEQYRKMGRGYFFLYYPNIVSMEMGRGCLGRCKFCSVWKFHNGEYRVQSTSRTVAEMAALPPEAKYLVIVDDLAFSSAIQLNPLTGRKELYDPGLVTARLMKERGLEERFRMWAQMRADNVYPKNPDNRPTAERKLESLAEVGLDMTLVGVEDFVHAQNLKETKKGSSLETNIRAAETLRDKGIRLWAAQILFPDWDADDYIKVIATNNELQIEAPQFTILTPLPGSEDYERAWNAGILTTMNPGRYNFFDWVIPTKLPPERTYELIAKLYQETGSSIASKKAIKADLKEGRTTHAALRNFKDIFEKMQNPEAHLANIRQYDPEEEEKWKERIKRNRQKYAP